MSSKASIFANISAMCLLMYGFSVRAENASAFLKCVLDSSKESLTCFDKLISNKSPLRRNKK